jgi:hypothetical protein
MFFKFQTLFLSLMTEMAEAGSVGQALGAQPGIFDTDQADTKTTMALFGGFAPKRKKKRKKLKKRKFLLYRRPLHKKDL